MREMARSRELQARAAGLLPGGVDSPVRAFRAVGGDPPFVARAEGAYLWDVDGNRYLDCFGSWGPMILGHAFPPVVKAIREAAARGGQLRRVARRRGGPGGAGSALFSHGRAAALCELGHRSLHERDPARARFYGAEVHRQVRGLLPRPCGCAAGESGLRHRDARHSGLRRRAGGDRDAYACAAVQRHRRGRKGLSDVSIADCMRHRRAGGWQCRHHRAAPGLSRTAAHDHAGVWRAADPR